MIEDHLTELRTEGDDPDDLDVVVELHDSDCPEALIEIWFDRYPRHSRATFVIEANTPDELRLIASRSNLYAEYAHAYVRWHSVAMAAGRNLSNLPPRGQARLRKDADELLRANLDRLRVLGKTRRGISDVELREFADEWKRRQKAGQSSINKQMAFERGLDKSQISRRYQRCQQLGYL